MDSKSKIKVRDATTEDAGGIHGLARELAETVGHQGAARGAPGRTQGAGPRRRERGRDRGRGELLDQTRPRPR
jgi:hypothetical protein